MKVTLDIPEALAAWLRQHAGRRSLSHVIVADALPVFRAAVAGELEARPRRPLRVVKGGRP